jgi:hypothetical protein
MTEPQQVQSPQMLMALCSCMVLASCNAVVELLPSLCGPAALLMNYPHSGYKCCGYQNLQLELPQLWHASVLKPCLSLTVCCLWNADLLTGSIALANAVVITVRCTLNSGQPFAAGSYTATLAASLTRPGLSDTAPSTVSAACTASGCSSLQVAVVVVVVAAAAVDRLSLLLISVLRCSAPSCRHRWLWETR